MSAIDRIVSALIDSETPLERSALVREATKLLPSVAPLADSSTAEAAVDTIVGMGPLQPLVDDASISDVLVNGPDEVWIERGGELLRTGVRFTDDAAILAMVRRLISPLGLRLDRAQPAVDARLPDGSRLHAATPPASVDGTILAIRRFHPAVGSIDDLHAAGSIGQADADALVRAVGERRNILVVGPTGAGKTTLLNVLGSLIEPSERVVTIEDAAELRLPGHVVRLESRRANADGVGDISMRDLVRHALRLRPDRLVVGEVRGSEALDMVQALTTGHVGSMSTVHADDAESALARVETLAAMAPERVPHAAVARLVSAAFHVVVVVERGPDGRRVRGVHDVAGGTS